MKNIDLTNWVDFSAAIEEIRKEYGKRILFRGQANNNWELKTTLERASNRSWTIKEYAETVLRCAPRIETFTEKKWNLTLPQNLDKYLEDNLDDVRPFIPDYSFWVYLRHHGFPSPLLDWSASPFVAVFFAFADKTDANNSSIYAFVNSKDGSKGGFIGAPQINIQGPYFRTHRRHFLQQASYTVCTSFINNNHHFRFHEEVTGRDDDDQDILIKITLPRSERSEIISSLNDCNINYFTLFHSDEMLIKTLAMDEIERFNL